MIKEEIDNFQLENIEDKEQLKAVKYLIEKSDYTNQAVLPFLLKKGKEYVDRLSEINKRISIISDPEVIKTITNAFRELEEEVINLPEEANNNVENYFWKFTDKMSEEVDSSLRKMADNNCLVERRIKLNNLIGALK
jgi:hypothetical protein